MTKTIFNVVLKKDIKDIAEYIEKQLQEKIIDKNKYGHEELQVNIEIIHHC